MLAQANAQGLTQEAILAGCAAVVGDFPGRYLWVKRKMFWANLIPIILIAVVLVALPSLSGPTAPLGVSVPSTRLADPVVHRSLRRYRIGVLACSVVVALAVALLTPGAIADDAAPFVLLAAAFAVFGWARRPIRRAQSADASRCG